jgi:hypothetical protein
MAQLWETPTYPQGPAPDLGQHTAEVLGRVRDGLSPWNSADRAGRPQGTASERQAAASSPAAGGSARRRPLDGITVLELASHYAAPIGIKFRLVAQKKLRRQDSW